MIRSYSFNKVLTPLLGTEFTVYMIVSALLRAHLSLLTSLTVLFQAEEKMRKSPSPTQLYAVEPRVRRSKFYDKIVRDEMEYARATRDTRNTPEHPKPVPKVRSTVSKSRGKAFIDMEEVARVSHPASRSNSPRPVPAAPANARTFAPSREPSRGPSSSPHFTLDQPGSDLLIGRIISEVTNMMDSAYENLLVKLRSPSPARKAAK